MVRGITLLIVADAVFAVITSVEVDANDSDNTAASKTKVLGEMLFEDSFESGDLGAWDEIPP